MGHTERPTWRFWAHGYTNWVATDMVEPRARYQGEIYLSAQLDHDLKCATVGAPVQQTKGGKR